MYVSSLLTSVGPESSDDEVVGVGGRGRTSIHDGGVGGRRRPSIRDGGGGDGLATTDVALADG